MNQGRKYWVTAFVLGMALLAAVPAFAQAKNVFVMISDGTSFGAWDAADLFTNGSVASSTYYGAEFKKYLNSTFPMNMSNVPTMNNTQLQSYVSAEAWDATPVPGFSAYTGTNPYTSDPYLAGFKAYEYLRQNPTDSAAAATAMATGQKTYNNAINWSNSDSTLKTIVEYAQDCGKATGTISSVQWSHATPAGFSDAHNISRNNYVEIANAMLSGKMDVIMGAGNPDFDDNGNLKSGSKQYKYAGGETTWKMLKAGDHPHDWNLIQSKSAFQDIANGNLPSNLRVVGVPEVGGTLQQSRSGFAPTDKVNEDPFNANVPTLEIMTQAAVNLLDAKSQANGDKGFFLHVEGGAVDWAAHANQTSRIIEEQIDFNNSVDWVVNWIKSNGGWDENLLIITTDHANSMPLGPDSGTVMFDSIELADVTGVPNIKWHSGDHMNQLVPLFVAGAGAEMFDTLVDGVDNGYGDDPDKKGFLYYYPDWYKAGFDGRYVDNTDMFYVMKSQVCPTPIPGTLLLMGSGVVGMILIGIRRKRA